MGKELVTITKREYERLTEAENKLECLYAAGVDNWIGYSEAMSMLNEEEEE
jgi:hypothetical protein